MDNDDGNNPGDYGNEDYNDPNGGAPDDMNGNNEGGDGGDVDQYFDDAGDIGYLPADHVTPLFEFNCLFIAFNATPAECLDQAVD